MQINSLTLQNFRSFDKNQLEFDPKITIIVGQNTAGKTNILESINLLATGKSFRATAESEMIKRDADVARVSAQITANSEQDTLEIVITRGELNGVKVPRKKLSINGAPRAFYKFVGTFRTVLFSPEDMDLVSGSPSLRRKFLDSVCSQVDLEYRRALLSYEKGLRQRNRLLQRIREGEAKPSQLLFWNQLLIRNGELLTKLREEFINFVNLSESINDEELALTYDHSIISPTRLEEYREEEISAGATLVGPHRDDLIFNARRTSEEWRNLALFGSRGEQRMGVLWIKLAELSFIDGKTGSRPVLLLDDVFSELDHKHREIVMQVITRQQSVLTTADPHTIEEWKKTGTIVELGFDR